MDVINNGHTTFPPTWTRQNISNLNSSPCDKPIQESPENQFYTALMILLLLMSIIGNAIVIIAVWLSSKLTERSTFYFVGSLGKLSFDLLYCRCS